MSASVQFRCEGTYDDNIYDHRDGHGTFVAGVSSALNNSIGVVGAACGATLWSANISDDRYKAGVRYSNMDYHEAGCAIEVGRANGVRVVNMSWGGGTDTSSTFLTDQINGGFNYDNMLFVAAVGNQDSAAILYPANLANVIAVTGTDSASNNQDPDANEGSQIDIAAPGVAIYSAFLPSGDADCATYNSGYNAVCSGTSAAAPHVAAAAALLMARYPSWTNVQVRDRLLATATDLGTSGFDNKYGNGLLNVQAALGMTAAVSGLSVAWFGVQQTWNAVVSGGQTPYAYQWTVNGSSGGTSSSTSYTPGISDFWVKLQVTDYNSLVAKDSVFVTVIFCTPPAISC